MTSLPCITWPVSLLTKWPTTMLFRQRAVFEFLVKEEIPAAEIHQRLQRAYGCVCMGVSSVLRWVKHFKMGTRSSKRVTFLWTLFVFLSFNSLVNCFLFYVAKQFKRNMQTDLMSPDSLRRPQVIAQCDIMFNLNSSINITTISHPMPRIIAIDERHNLSKAPKTSQMLLFWQPVISSSYDVW